MEAFLPRCRAACWVGESNLSEGDTGAGKQDVVYPGSGRNGTSAGMSHSQPCALCSCCHAGASHKQIIHSASLPFLLILSDKINVHGQCYSMGTLLHPHQIRDTKFTGEKELVYVNLRAALGSSFSGPDHMTFFTN